MASWKRRGSRTAQVTFDAFRPNVGVGQTLLSLKSLFCLKVLLQTAANTFLGQD